MVIKKVAKYVKPNGRCLIDEWLNSSSITKRDRACFDSKVDNIISTEGDLPAETVKKYKNTNLYELKIRGDNKQLRPLCILANGCLIILLGTVKKGAISSGEIKSAENLRLDYIEGKGTLEYYE